MPRKSVPNGCDQAVFPFSVATSSVTVPSPTTTSARQKDQNLELPADLARLYLSLKQDERVRVLQRDRQHGRGAAVDSVLAQWCIAQREDGAVGLVPVSILYRVPGVTFTLRHVSSAQQHRHHPKAPSSPVLSSASTHSDPVQDLPATSPQENRFFDPRSGPAGTGDDDDGIDDALELQRRRQTSLKKRIEAFQSPEGKVDQVSEGHCVNKNKTAGVSSSFSGDVQLPQRNSSGNTPPDVGRGSKVEGVNAERSHLLNEIAQISAEVGWLQEEVLPTLHSAYETKRYEVFKRKPRVTTTTEKKAVDSADVSFLALLTSTPTNGSTNVAEVDRTIAAEERYLAEQLQVAQALKTRLERKAARGGNGDSSDEEKLLSQDVQKYSEKVRIFSSRDLNCPSTNKTSNADNGFPVHLTRKEDMYQVEKLRCLVHEECETMRCYRDQERELQRRLASLDQLTLELLTEETALTTSEMALKIVVAAQAEQRTDPTADPWPRTLPGLTDEEEVALCSSITTCDKYSRKLQALDPTMTSGLTSSLDLSEIRGGTTSARSPSPGTDESLLLSLSTTPEKRTTVRCAAASTIPGANSASPSAQVVEHLRQVLEKGDNEYLQLQTKLKTLKEFCSTYGPAAREIDVQLQRGRHILEEKQKCLAQFKK